MSKAKPAAPSRPDPVPEGYPFRWAVEVRRTNISDVNAPYPPSSWRSRSGITTHYAGEILTAESVSASALPGFLHDLAAHLDLVKDVSGDDAFVIVGRRRGVEIPPLERGEDESDAAYARRLLSGLIDSAVRSGDLDPSQASFLELYAETRPVPPTPAGRESAPSEPPKRKKRR